MNIDEFIADIECAVQVLKAQQPHYRADPRFLDRAAQVFRPVRKWVQEVRHHESRRSLPVTNGNAKSRKTLPSSLIGYKYVGPHAEHS